MSIQEAVNNMSSEEYRRLVNIASPLAEEEELEFSKMSNAELLDLLFEDK